MASFIRVETGGAPFAMGVDLGRAVKELLKELVADSASYYRKRTGRNIAAAKRYAARHFLPFVRRRYPGHLDEVGGIARGAGLAFDDVFFLTADEEMVDLWSKDHCSTVAARTGRGLLLAHNEDYPRRYLGRMVIVHAEPERGPAFLSLTYPYVLAGPSCGINAEGLAFAVDSLAFPPRRRGIPTNFILRDVYRSGRIAAARRALAAGPALMSNAVTVVSSSERKALTVEAGPKAAAVVAMGDASCLPHTNHVRSAKLAGGGERPSWSSKMRLAALEHLLGGRRRIDARDLLAALSSAPHGLLRRGKEAGESLTIATALMDPGRKTMYICNRAGKENFKAYRL
jgi:isopenicillin-N N-acyltransferase-like protein